MTEFIYWASPVGVIVAFGVCIWGITGCFSRDKKVREKGAEQMFLGALIGVACALLL